MNLAVPGEWLRDLRDVEEWNEESLEGIVGTKSVLRLPKYPLAHPAGVVGLAKPKKGSLRLSPSHTCIGGLNNLLSRFR